MIIGIGSDLVDVRRIEAVIERRGDRFLARCFHQSEIESAQKKNCEGARSAFFAKRFAAKEAAAKALGTGIADGVQFKDIYISNDVHGAPNLNFTGGALEALQKKLPSGKTEWNLFVSLGDELPYAQAFVVIEAI